jgi:hypothetical protein
MLSFYHGLPTNFPTDIAWADAVKYACIRTLKEYGGPESTPHSRVAQLMLMPSQLEVSLRAQAGLAS